MSDLYLFDIGWLFFAAWSAIVAAVVLTAFASDFFPSSARLGERPGSQFRRTGKSDPRVAR